MAIEDTYDAVNSQIIQTALTGVPDRGPLSEAGKLRRGGTLETKTEAFATKHNELLREFKNGGWLSNEDQLNQLEGKIWAFEKKYVETKNPDRALRDQAIADLKYIKDVCANLRENPDSSVKRHADALHTVAVHVLLYNQGLTADEQKIVESKATEYKKKEARELKITKGTEDFNKKFPTVSVSGKDRKRDVGDQGVSSRRYVELGDISRDKPVDFEKETRKAKEQKGQWTEFTHTSEKEHLQQMGAAGEKLLSKSKEKREAHLAEIRGKKTADLKKYGSHVKEYDFSQQKDFRAVTPEGRKVKPEHMEEGAFAARKAELEPKLRVHTGKAYEREKPVSSKKVTREHDATIEENLAARAEKDKAERDAVGPIKQELIGAINAFIVTKEGKTIKTALQNVVTQLEKKDLSKDELNRIATNFYDTTFDKFVDKQDKFSVFTVLRQANELKEKASDLFDLFMTAETEREDENDEFFDAEGGHVSEQRVTTGENQQKQVNKQLEKFFMEKLVELSKLRGYEGLRDMITAKTPTGQTLIVTVDDQIERLMKQGMPAMLRKMDLQGMQIAIGRTTAGLNATVVKQRFIDAPREASENERFHIKNAGKSLIEAFMKDYELDESEGDRDAKTKLFHLALRFSKIDKEADIKELGREALALIKKLTNEASNTGMEENTLLAYHELNKLVEW